MDACNWQLKRNCSLAPLQLGYAYAVLCGMSLFVAAPFAVLHGAWQVLVFAFAELGAAGIAFLHYARHATDREQVTLTDDWLLVERELGMHKELLRLDSRRARVMADGNGRDLVRIEADGVKVQVGRFVTEAKRRRFAEELRGALRQAPFSGLGAAGR